MQTALTHGSLLIYKIYTVVVKNCKAEKADMDCLIEALLRGLQVLNIKSNKY